MRVNSRMPAQTKPNTAVALLTQFWGWFSGMRIQAQLSIAPDLAEVEHLVDGTCNRVKRALTNALSTQPVVFDEVDD